LPAFFIAGLVENEEDGEEMGRKGKQKGTFLAA